MNWKKRRFKQLKCGKKTETQIDFCKTIPNVHLRFMYFRVASRTPLLIWNGQKKNHKFTHFLSPRCFFFSSLPWRKYGGAFISTVKKCWRFFVIIWKFKSKQTCMCLKRMTRNLVESMQHFFSLDYFRQDSKSQNLWIPNSSLPQKSKQNQT